jgi:hypothetical protein
LAVLLLETLPAQQLMLEPGLVVRQLLSQLAARQTINEAHSKPPHPVGQGHSCHKCPIHYFLLDYKSKIAKK